MNILVKFGVVSLALGLTDVVALAAPSINSISGTISNSQSIIISGDAFGSKSPAAPLIWDTFENGSEGALIQNVSAVNGEWGSGSGSDNVFYTNTMGYGGSAKAAMHPFNSSKYNSSLSKNGTFSVLYIDFKRYYPSANGNPSNYKPYRMYGGSDTMELYKGYGCGYQVHTVLDSGYNNTNWASQQISNDKWQHYQLIYKASAPKVADGTIISLIDGVTNGQNNNAIQTRSVSTHLDQIRIGHYFDTGSRDGCSPASNSVLYTDNVYIDTTWSRVEIGNAATYAASTHREVQIPFAWSTSSVSVTVNTGSFTAGETAYLYVFDSTGAVNSAGYAVKIGNSGSTPVSVPAPVLNVIKSQ